MSQNPPKSRDYASQKEPDADDVWAEAEQLLDADFDLDQDEDLDLDMEFGFDQRQWVDDFYADTPGDFSLLKAAAILVPAVIVCCLAIFWVYGSRSYNV